MERGLERERVGKGFEVRSQTLVKNGTFGQKEDFWSTAWGLKRRHFGPHDPSYCLK